MIEQALLWISESPLANWVISSAFIWPTLECIHFVSLCVLFGSILVVDLRLIGFFRDRCSATLSFLIRLALVAFAANLATGVLFFFGNTFKYVGNSAFELKLALILAAGLNALFFKLRLAHLIDAGRISPGSIVVGWLSLALWAGVIVCGRMITFYA